MLRRKVLNDSEYNIFLVYRYFTNPIKILIVTTLTESMPLEEDIKQVSKDLLGDFPLFPYRCCTFAVKDMHKKGYEIIAGFVKVDNYCGMDTIKELRHYWNKVPQTNISFDITSSQFNIHLRETFPNVLVWQNDEITKYIPTKEGISPYEVI